MNLSSKIRGLFAGLGGGLVFLAKRFGDGTFLPIGGKIVAGFDRIWESSLSREFSSKRPGAFRWGSSENGLRFGKLVRQLVIRFGSGDKMLVGFFFLQPSSIYLLSMNMQSDTLGILYIYGQIIGYNLKGVLIRSLSI